MIPLLIIGYVAAAWGFYRWLLATAQEMPAEMQRARCDAPRFALVARRQEAGAHLPRRHAV